MDYTPPKYIQVMSTIQQRIEAGEYRPGDMLPSETQLVRELGVGRTTVVRALQTLAMQGWITREHGRGSFVKGRPESPAERVRPAGRRRLRRRRPQRRAALLTPGTDHRPNPRPGPGRMSDQ